MATKLNKATYVSQRCRERTGRPGALFSSGCQVLKKLGNRQYLRSRLLGVSSLSVYSCGELAYSSWAFGGQSRVR